MDPSLDGRPRATLFDQDAEPGARRAEAVRAAKALSLGAVLGLLLALLARRRRPR